MRNSRVYLKKIGAGPTKPIVGPQNKRRGSAEMNRKPWKERIVSKNAVSRRAANVSLSCRVVPRISTRANGLSVSASMTLAARVARSLIVALRETS